VPPEVEEQRGSGRIEMRRKTGFCKPWRSSLFLKLVALSSCNNYQAIFYLLLTENFKIFTNQFVSAMYNTFVFILYIKIKEYFFSHKF
jgi:hypothetical protein